MPRPGTKVKPGAHSHIDMSPAPATDEPLFGGHEVHWIEPKEDEYVLGGHGTVFSAAPPGQNDPSGHGWHDPSRYNPAPHSHTLIPE